MFSPQRPIIGLMTTMPLRNRTRTLLHRAERRTPHNAPIAGTVRLGKRTKDLVKQLQPGEIAVIDHADLDRMAAEDLVASGVVAVLNVAPSSTDRYPNAGPLILARSGVRLMDVGIGDLFRDLKNGDEITIAATEIHKDDEWIARGRVLDVITLERRLESQRLRVDDALAAFAENTSAHVREEGRVLLGDVQVPATRTVFRDRHVLIVVRGTTYRSDLRALRGYIQDVKPVIVGVDGGADAILEEGLTPDLILGDMDSATDKALNCGAELIVHAYADGSAPGSARLRELGIAHAIAPAIGTSEDVAMLLAYERGAQLIVTVGAHFNLVEFLDKDRAGMSSTFLTRLRIGEVLVDAKGVSRLYNPGVSGRLVALFFLIAAVLAVVVVLSSPALEELVDLLWLKVKVTLGIN